jgi:hypothetical protein
MTTCSRRSSRLNAMRKLSCGWRTGMRHDGFRS